MEELRQAFLKETIQNLEDLQSGLQNQMAGMLSPEFRQRLFRSVHSIKGTAQTFNLNNLSRLAHEIENLLQAINSNSIQQGEEISILVEESIANFLESCRREEFQPSSDFFEKIARLSLSDGSVFLQNNLEGKIPQSLLAKLSTGEINNLKAAFGRGKSFYLVEAFFDMTEFNERFIDFREILGENGEVIAVSPSDKTTAAEKIGFQIFYVTGLQSSRIERILAPYDAKIEFESGAKKIKYAADLNGLLANLITDCEKKARILDKKVSFEIFNQVNDVSRPNLILINHCLLHLLRNAVDHAIESPEARIAANKAPQGKIKINIFRDDTALILRIEDDGKGIDAKKITLQAKKYGIIGDDQIPEETEALNLIFAHGFSTSEVVSDISGRGVGLDIVKDLIEKSGGKITVETKLNHGTIFEIKLPRQKFSF